MEIQVDFITHGDAARRLDVPPGTLRNWADQMEEFRAHYVKRVDGNRVYYENDLEVFTFIRDMKEEHGRKTTTKNLAYILAEKGKQGEFKLRSIEDAPQAEHNRDVLDLLNQEDIKQLMESNRVQQFMRVISDGIREDLMKEFDQEREEMKKERNMLLEILQKQNDNIKNELKDRFEKHDKLLTQTMRDMMEQKKGGFFSRLFGGK